MQKLVGCTFRIRPTIPSCSHVFSFCENHRMIALPCCKLTHLSTLVSFTYAYETPPKHQWVYHSTFSASLICPVSLSVANMNFVRKDSLRIQECSTLGTATTNSSSVPAEGHSLLPPPQPTGHQRPHSFIYLLMYGFRMSTN